MRILLVFLLTLLPCTGHTADSIPLSEYGDHQNITERSTSEIPSEEEYRVDHRWPYASPYDPSSPTNFDAFVTPLESSSDANDRSRLSLYLSESGPLPSIYGHFGSPFFPDSINCRNGTNHPYALDSPTNHFGRSWLTEKR